MKLIGVIEALNKDAKMLQSHKSKKLSAAKLEGALRLAFRIYRDTVDNPIMGTDRENLVRAVQDGNITALKEMESNNKFTLAEIVEAAIDKDQYPIVEEFKEEIQSNDTVTVDDLLDYSIKKKAMNTSRKLSGTLNELGRRAMPLLTMAMEKKDTEYVNQILDKSLDDFEDLQESPLHMAARSASGIMARSLTERNSKWVHMRSSGGRTPLHIAAEEGSADVCEALLECGADVDAKDERGRTPLYCCVERRVDGDVECMEVLFKHIMIFNILSITIKGSLQAHNDY